jgi:hypothetical protein
MEIRSVEDELFHAGGRTDGETWRNQQSLFAILEKANNKNALEDETFTLGQHDMLVKDLF